MLTGSSEQLPIMAAFDDDCSCFAPAVTMAGSSEQLPFLAGFDDNRTCSQAEGSSALVSMRTPTVIEMKTGLDLLSDTAMQIPLKFLAESFTMWFYVPEGCTNLLTATLNHVRSTTNADIRLSHGHAGFSRLFISGRIPDIYSAHLKLIWCVQSDKQKLTGVEAAIENTIAQLTAMQQEHQQTMAGQQQTNLQKCQLLRPKRRRPSEHQSALEISVPET